MPASQILSNLEVEAVGLSWTQENRSDFLFDGCPIVRAKGEFSGVGTSTYKIPALDNFMLQTHLNRWTPGQADAKERILKKTDVVVTPSGRQTDYITRPSRRPRTHAFRDLETNLVPGLLGMVFQGIDRELFEFLTNSSNFTQNTFTATSGASGYIANSADHGNQNVLNDLRGDLDGIRKYRRRDMPLEIWTTRNVIEILAHHPSLTGHGALITNGSNYAANSFGSGTPAAITFDGVVAGLTQLCGVDAIRVSQAIGDDNKRGQSSSLDEIARNLLWAGIVDRRKRSFDITDPSATFDAPDGAICLAMEEDPYVHQSQDADGEVDKYRGRTSIEIFSPRGSTMGFYYKTTGGTGSIAA